MEDQIQPPEERRHARRAQLFYYFRVFSKSGNLVGFLVDISHNGIMVISENPIEIYKNYQLHIRPPAEIYGKSSLEFEAQAVWGRKHSSPEFYSTGFEFVQILPEDIELINRLIADFEFGT